MVVNSIFKNVKYPKDRESIEHIITEYDKNLEYKVSGILNSKRSSIFYTAFSILVILYILKCTEVSFIIRALYLIPLAATILYNIVLFKKAGNNNYKDEKLIYKFNNSSFLLLIMFIYSATFLIENSLFNEWTDENYLISFGILFLLFLLTFIWARIKAPEKFIKNFQNKKSKVYTPSSIIFVVVAVLVSIANFSQPNRLILIVSYIFLVLISGLITNSIFICQQYDRIQELKKEINYRPTK